MGFLAQPFVDRELHLSIELAVCERRSTRATHELAVENYISEHTATRFSHGICPSCMETRVEPQLSDGE